MATKTQEFNALNGEFDLAKNTIVTGLNAKIQVLQGIAGGANVTAEAIQSALDTDKQNPIDDKNLGEIKGRAAKLAADFGTKATIEFATRKAEIEGKIEEDKKTFQEKQKIIEEYQGIMRILDSQEVKEKEAAIQENITKAKVAEAEVVNESGNITRKMLKNTMLGTKILELHTSISSLETELTEKLKSLNIQNLESKLQELQTRSAKIQPPPIDLAQIQARLNAINEAKAEYKRLSEARDDLAAKLKAETPVPPSFPRPNTARPVPVSVPVSVSVPVLKPGDAGDSADNESTPEEKRTPGRRYSIFIPTPVQKKTSTSRAYAAAARNTDNTEDAIDPTVLEIFVYEDEASASDSMSGGGGGIIQRGGEPPKVAKIIKVKQITPEIQNLFLSFESPNKTLTPEFLNSIEENIQSTEVVDTPKDIDTEMANIKRDELIQNDDTTDFFESIGKKVDHKSTITKLMSWLDIKLQQDKKYQNLYNELWRFMDYTDCLVILKNFISDYDIKLQNRTIIQTENKKKKAEDKKGLQQILGWTSRQTNTLYDNLLMDISKCEELVPTFGRSKLELRDTGKYSTFIHNRFQGRGYRFMLNWLILFALHVYNAESNTKQKTILL